MKLLVTRPAAQAAEWVGWLCERGIGAEALPLIGIFPPREVAPVREAWAALATKRLVVFVSPNAAEQFFDLRPPALAWPEHTLAGSPGPGTSRVLRSLGVPAACIVEPAADSLQFDSESLWLTLRGHDWHGAAVLIVRGESGRDWLADTLRARGAQVGFVTAYERRAAVLDDAQRALLRAALADPTAWLWMFSSSESIDHLESLAPGSDWRASVALATHPRIAARARAAGFGAVHECRPSLDAVVACLQSIGFRSRSPT
ncbi:uroporphyrinogen-III synthase [uncultured Piscinibacter sp.]|uniref:uroporphyrinogen-III synthase n=1 Tax=uncultured Piscinibacter sp. TaxID=1131835 RepID=UPI002607A063|nr:uroporphyrinogen-III synthase [uncultured Piscinibacter sp.]